MPAALTIPYTRTTGYRSTTLAPLVERCKRYIARAQHTTGHIADSAWSCRSAGRERISTGRRVSNIWRTEGRAADTATAAQQLNIRPKRRGPGIGPARPVTEDGTTLWIDGGCCQPPGSAHHPLAAGAFHRPFFYSPFIAVLESLQGDSSVNTELFA
jgi:hypothetical protein